MGMNIMNEALSEAVVAYLGKGRSPFPRADEDAVAVDADPETRAALIESARSLVEECLAIAVDWSTSTLPEGGRQAQATMAERHPELSPAALEALYWSFTYNWR